MEILVGEEIERQMARQPANLKQYINRVEVATYALNRLPPLYASSHEGCNKQKLKGRAQHSAQITKIVRQAFAAVQKDLLRSCTPLIAQENTESKDAKKALQELTDFLPHREFSWENLVKLVKPVLVQLSHKNQPITVDDLKEAKFKQASQSSSEWGNSVYSK